MMIVPHNAKVPLFKVEIFICYGCTLDTSPIEGVAHIIATSSGANALGWIGVAPFVYS